MYITSASMIRVVFIAACVFTNNKPVFWLVRVKKLSCSNAL